VHGGNVAWGQMWAKRVRREEKKEKCQNDKKIIPGVMMGSNQVWPAGSTTFSNGEYQTGVPLAHHHHHHHPSNRIGALVKCLLMCNSQGQMRRYAMLWPSRSLQFFSLLLQIDLGCCFPLDLAWLGLDGCSPSPRLACPQTETSQLLTLPPFNPYSGTATMMECPDFNGCVA